jgi:hypothetical protein
LTVVSGDMSHKLISETPGKIHLYIIFVIVSYVTTGTSNGECNNGETEGNDESQTTSIIDPPPVSPEDQARQKRK